VACRCQVRARCFFGNAARAIWRYPAGRHHRHSGRMSPSRIRNKIVFDPVIMNVGHEWHVRAVYPSGQEEHITGSPPKPRRKLDRE
jgi:hypothetical protein